MAEDRLKPQSYDAPEGLLRLRYGNGPDLHQIRHAEHGFDFSLLEEGGALRRMIFPTLELVDQKFPDLGRYMNRNNGFHDARNDARRR